MVVVGLNGSKMTAYQQAHSQEHAALFLDIVLDADNALYQ